jgi:hypothetical protein
MSGSPRQLPLSLLKLLPLIFPLANVLLEQVSSRTVLTVSWDAASLTLALAMLVSAPIPRRLSVKIPLSALLAPAFSSLAQTASEVAVRTTPAARSFPFALHQSLSDLTTQLSAHQAQAFSSPAPTVSAVAARVTLVVRRSPSALPPLPSDPTILLSALPELASSSLALTDSVAAVRTTPAARPNLSALPLLLSDLTTPPSALLEPVSSSPAPTASEAAARVMPVATLGAPTTRPVPTSLPSPSRSRLALTEPALLALASSRFAPTASRDAARRMLVVRADLSAPSKRWIHFHYFKPCE